MASTTESPSTPWTDDLPAERARLVRLCARLTGNYDAAEDLAQETLFEAWRQAGNLRDESVWRSFVVGIARNVCLRWMRSQGRELAHRAYQNDTYDGDPFGALLETEAAADPFDIELSLEQAEIAQILDRAMGLLPEPTRALLIERYVEDLPQAEMAEKRGMTDNALGVRIHRAKATLQKILATDEFRDDAASYGLISSDSADGWQETRLWCPRCGKRRLLGRFRTEKLEAGGAESPNDPNFAVRCPYCERALGYDFTSGHPGMATSRVLRDVRGFKPALNRLSGWWQEYYAKGLRTGKAACPLCGIAANMTPSPPIGTHPGLAQLRGVYIACVRCAQVCCITASGIAYHLDEVQQFWRDHPRMALTDERDVNFGGQDAVAVTFKSQTDSTAVEVVLSRTNFQTLRVGKPGEIARK